MSERKLAILGRAERLATDLTGGEPAVKKSTFQAVVSDFHHRPDRERLRQALRLLQAGSGGHSSRGEGFGEQVTTVCEQLLPLLDEDEWSPEEMKSLFGWTARCLLIRSEVLPKEKAQPPAARHGRGPVRSRPEPSALPPITLADLREDRAAAALPRHPPKRVSVIVLGVEKGDRYRLRVEGPFAGEVTLQAGGLSWREGDRKKVRVIGFDEGGRIRKVAP